MQPTLRRPSAQPLGFLVAAEFQEHLAQVPRGHGLDLTVTDLAGDRQLPLVVGSWSWRRAFKRAAASIGQGRLRVHDLRHLSAINLGRACVDLPTVQAHLGHRHLVSTLRYASYADETASARAARAQDRIHGESDADDDA